jgi:hypothetical protein
MNYKVKQTWALLFTSLLVISMYLKRLVEVYSRDGMVIFDNTGFWAKTMLIYIAIFVLMTIVVMILFHILVAIGAAVKNKIDGEINGSLDNDIDDVFDDVEDEMDRLINLKAGKVSYIIVGVGFVAGLITLTFDLAFGIMLNILYLSFMLGGIMEGVIKLYLYKRGVSHG